MQKHYGVGWLITDRIESPVYTRWGSLRELVEVDDPPVLEIRDLKLGISRSPENDQVVFVWLERIEHGMFPSYLASLDGLTQRVVEFVQGFDPDAYVKLSCIVFNEVAREVSDCSEECCDGGCSGS